MLPEPEKEEGVAFPPRPTWSFGKWLLAAITCVAVIILYWVSLKLVQFDLERLARGIPTMMRWAQRSWPPDLNGFGLLLHRAGETLAMALIGTTLGCIIAFPLALLAARNINPNRWLQQSIRGVLNALRGIDTMIFAIIFVVAVGLGPFAGVLGVTLHTAGIVAKLWSETIETVNEGPLEAMALTGATRIQVVFYALLPDILPALTSISLYAIEFNVRGSAVLGLVGAGGIGQELKNSVDLLNFPRILTIVAIILVMVSVVDQISAHVRRRMI